MIELFNGMGNMLGPVIGGFLFDYSWKDYQYVMPFALSLIMCILLFILSSFVFPDEVSDIYEKEVSQKVETERNNNLSEKLLKVGSNPGPTVSKIKDVEG